KNDEVKYLDGQLSPAVLFENLKSVVVKRWPEVKEKSKIPTLTYVDAAGNPTDDSSQGADIRVTTWGVNKAVVEEFHQLLTDLLPIATRVLDMAENKAHAMHAKIEKKKDVVKAADDAMPVDKDPAKAGPSTQALVDKAVAGKVKNLQAQIKKVS
ncbi:hypothetical protein C8Q73DRAFT_612470, partial [Cubamyces lactineus]